VIKKYYVGSFAVFAMIVLILDAETALKGAQDGVMLCIQTIIPSLFPFFYISGLINRSLLGFSGKALRPLGRLCGIPSGAEPLLLLGLIGGYPVGAQAISRAYQAGCIRKQDAERMLGFCSNAGPAFIFGMAGSLFESKWIPWALWGIVIISSMLTGIMLPGKSNTKCHISKAENNKPLDQSLKAMGIVCGWVILFRVLILFLCRWVFWIFPNHYSIILSGILELTNGCVSLYGITDTVFQFTVLAGLLSFGGICVGLQTVSVTETLNTKTYFKGKLMQTMFSLAISWVLCSILFPRK